MANMELTHRSAASDTGARLSMKLGALLVFGAALSALHVASREGIGIFSRPAATVESAATHRPLVLDMPPAHGEWRRTDYVGPDLARGAALRISGDFGLAPPAQGGDLPADGATAHYAGPGGQFFIHAERKPPAEGWTPPKGPVRILAGRIFQNRAPGRDGIVDLVLQTPQGLHLVIRGRGDLRMIEPFVERLSLW